MEDFDWDDANRSHIGRHGVTPEEAEEVYLGAPLDLDCYEADGEWRCDCVGETKRGRMLLVVTTIRDDAIRVVTCFEPTTALVRLYLAYQKDRHE